MVVPAPMCGSGQENPETYEQRLQRRKNSALTEVWDILDTISDPEIPVLSLWDLGVLQDIQQDGDTVIVTLMPTYSGCPALDVMKNDIQSVLSQHRFMNVAVKTTLSPAWSSDRLSPEGRSRLEQYGIAPPISTSKELQCPRCQNRDIQLISEFGSTPCKALYQCNRCLEPFDYFKSL